MVEGQQQTGNCDVLLQSFHAFLCSPLPHVNVVAGNKLNVENNTKMSFQAALTMPRSAQGRELSLRFTWRIMEQHQVPLRAQAGGRHELARQGSGLGTSVSPSWQPGKESCETEDTTSCYLTPLSHPQPSPAHFVVMKLNDDDDDEQRGLSLSPPIPLYLSPSFSLSFSLGVFLIKNKFRFSVRGKKKGTQCHIFRTEFSFWVSKCV